MAKTASKKSIDDIAQLSGAEKAAIILLALGEENHRLWEMMDDEEIKEVSQAMSNLGSVTAGAVEKLIVDFVSQMSSTGSLRGSFDATQRLLSSFLGDDKVDSVMEEIRGPAGRTIWDKLGNVNEAILANYLKNEYPQTVAVVLSQINSDHAAQVLSALPEEFSLEVIMRMLRMEPVQRDILEEIEATLRREFMSNLARTNKRDSHESMADIFNNFDRQTENRFLAAMEERNREAAERVRSLMFVFEDLQKLDPSGAQTLLRAIDKDQLGTAMKGASETLRDLFFSNMSERAAKILRDDMDAMGPVRLKDVESAQQIMVNAAKDLAAKGELLLADGSSEDELIY